jgi:outer membrane protein TolC
MTADFVRWWQVLHDPQLNWLIERAIATNPDIEIALTHVQEARLQQNVLLGAMLPTVAGSGGIASGSAGDLMRGRASQTLRAGDSTHGFGAISRMAGFDASWEIDLFGKLQRSLEAAVHDAEAQIDLRNAVLITVIADVARNYFEIRGLQIRLEIARKDVAEAKRTIDLVATRLKHGESNKSNLAPATNESEATSTKSGVRVSERRNKSSESKEMDLPLAEGELAIQLARLPELEAAISAAETRLAVLLGTYEADVAVATRGAARLPALPERPRPGAPVELLRRRPDIRAVERELAAATARIGVATADLFPSVTLTSGFGGQGTIGSTGTTPLIHGPIWSVGPGVNWSVLDFGRLDALIDIQEMRTHEVLFRYKKTIIDAVGEVNEAVMQYRLAVQRWKALRVALEAIRHGVNLATECYKGSDTEFRVLLGEQRWKYAREEQVAIAAEAAVLRYVAFYKALGGGWELYSELPPLPPVQPAIVAGVGRLTGGWR